MSEYNDELCSQNDNTSNQESFPGSDKEELSAIAVSSVSDERLSVLPLVSDSPKKKSVTAARLVQISDEFDSRDDFLLAYDTFAAHEQYGRRRKPSNGSKCFLRCPVASCSFTLHANRRANGKWVVTKSIAHNCRFDQRQKASKGMQVSMGKKLIEGVARELLVESKELMPSELQRALKSRFKFGNLLTSDMQLSRRVARALQSVRKEELDSAITQFKQLRGYLALVQKQLGAYKNVQYDKGSGQFQRLFLMLHATRDCVPKLRRVLGLDGAHLKNPSWNGILLLLTAKDSENRIIPLCMGIVESECLDSWTYFLRCLRDACPFLARNQERFLTVSDFDKGIWGGLRDVFPEISCTRDVVHMAGNIADECPNLDKTAIREQLLDLAACRTEDEWNKKLTVFLSQYPRDAKYLREFLKPEQFSDFKFPNHRRYGRYTSQFAESANKMIMPMRTASGIIDMVDSYLSVLTKSFADRRVAAERLLQSAEERALSELSERGSQMDVSTEDVVAAAREHCLSKYAEDVVLHRNKRAEKMQVTLTNTAGKSTVFNVETGKRVTVELGQRYCSDRKWLQEGIPCTHAIAALLAEGITSSPALHCLSSVWSLYAQVDPVWRAGTQLSLYSGENANLVSKDSLAKDQLMPPVARRRLPGRPRTNRILSRGEMKRKQCANCQQFGHNARSCKLAKLNGKSKLVGKNLATPAALPPAKRAKKTDSSEAPPSLESITVNLLDAVDSNCLRCGKRVPNRDFTDCKKCLRWIHGRCLPQEKGAAVDNKRFVCFECYNRVPSGEEEHPCAQCELECIDKLVQCDNEQCGSYTHLVCAGFDETTELEDVKFVCNICLRRQSLNSSQLAQQHRIIPCANAGNTCYFNCLIASLQAFPMTVLRKLAKENRFLSNIFQQIIDQEMRAVGIGSVCECVQESQYSRRFAFKQEHDAGEALLHVLEKTESVSMLRAELQFAESKTYTCSQCALVSYSMGDSNRDGRTTSLRRSKPLNEVIKNLYTPTSSSRLTSISLQELIWLNLQHDTVDDLVCSSVQCGNGRVEHALVTEIVDTPSYLALSIRREVVNKAKRIGADGHEDVQVSVTKNLIKLDAQLYRAQVVFSSAVDAARYEPVAVGFHKGKEVNRGHWWSHVKHPVTGNWWRVGDGNSRERRKVPLRSVQPETTVALVLLKKCDAIGANVANLVSFEPPDDRKQLLSQHWSNKEKK